jgi:UDP-N-acetylglucosamine 2-epimerase
MYKIMTIVGTRPEIIKMSLVIQEFDKFTKHFLVHTGQNFDYELNEIFFDNLNIRKPDFFLEVKSDNVAQAIGRIIERSYKVMADVKPDAILIYGDTNSCLSVISAKKLKIPIFHLEAGNRCFDQNVPEESNRILIDHMSDVNMVITDQAKNYLISEGIRADKIFKTGSHMKEVINFYRPRIESSHILKDMSLKKGEYFLFSFHREENVDDSVRLSKLLEIITLIEAKYEIPIIISTHPRTKNNIQNIKCSIFNKNINFCNPFGFFDYLCLQMNARCVISDSGTITEESALLGFPAITIRSSHERPEAMDNGVLIMNDINHKTILQSLHILLEQNKQNERWVSAPHDYDENYVSKKVLRIVVSYIDFINKFVWRKPLI